MSKPNSAPWTTRQRFGAFSLVVIVVNVAVWVGLSTRVFERNGTPQIVVENEPLNRLNHWERVTADDYTGRSGPVLKRIGVRGGWLYVTYGGGPESPTPVFIADPTQP